MESVTLLRDVIVVLRIIHQTPWVKDIEEVLEITTMADLHFGLEEKDAILHITHAYHVMKQAQFRSFTLASTIYGIVSDTKMKTQKFRQRKKIVELYKNRVKSEVLPELADAQEKIIIASKVHGRVNESINVLLSWCREQLLLHEMGNRSRASDNNSDIKHAAALGIGIGAYLLFGPVTGAVAAATATAFVSLQAVANMQKRRIRERDTIDAYRTFREKLMKLIEHPFEPQMRDTLTFITSAQQRLLVPSGKYQQEGGDLLDYEQDLEKICSVWKGMEKFFMRHQ